MFLPLHASATALINQRMKGNGMSNDESCVKEESLVIKHQDALEVFPNQYDGISIRMMRDMNQDQVISFQPEYAERIIAAISAAKTNLMAE